MTESARAIMESFILQYGAKGFYTYEELHALSDDELCKLYDNFEKEPEVSEEISSKEEE